MRLACIEKTIDLPPCVLTRIFSLIAVRKNIHSNKFIRWIFPHLSSSVCKLEHRKNVTIFTFALLGNCSYFQSCSLAYCGGVVSIPLALKIDHFLFEIFIFYDSHQTITNLTSIISMFRYYIWFASLSFVCMFHLYNFHSKTKK